MISYNITTGDTLTKVFQRIPGVGPDHILAERHFVILLSTVMFTLPLSLFRNIERLGKVSFLSMVLTLTILIIVMIRAATLGPQIIPTENAWAFAKKNAIQAVGVMSFAFICHHNSFLIYNSLEQPTLSNWSRVTHISVGSSLIISAAFAVAGYTTFTGYTQGIVVKNIAEQPFTGLHLSIFVFNANLLFHLVYLSGDIFENYCRDDNLATFGRFCFGFSIITTFPLECFVTREVVSKVICSRPLSKAEHVAITLLIVALCTALSLAFDCLGVVLEINGALSATPLIFIIPSACYLKLHPGCWFHSEKLIPTVLIIIGLFIMITTLIMTGLFPQDCSHGVDMFYCADANISGTMPPE
ncbi:putative sodium-coupled neutral amino acid transporter 11 isoform 2-T2 [Fundulus diaphanus]